MLQRRPKRRDVSALFHVIIHAFGESCFRIPSLVADNMLPVQFHSTPQRGSDRQVQTNGTTKLACSLYT